MLFAVDGQFAFRVGSLDEDCVEAGGRGGGEDEPGRAAHEVAAASLHDLHDLRDLAHRGHGEGEGLQEGKGVPK